MYLFFFFNHNNCTFLKRSVDLNYMKFILRIAFGLVLISSACSSVHALVFTKNLVLGSRGEEVKVMQQFLISQNLLTGTATGYYGAQTKKAVQVFQKQNKLAVTGNWYSPTRQKAELVSSATSKVKPPVVQTIAKASTTVVQAVSTSSVASSPVIVTIVPTSGGFVFSKEMNSTCYSYDSCRLKLVSSNKITLQAFPAEGYSFKGWSEASCGNAKECMVTIPGDTTIYATFEVSKKTSQTAHFTTLQHPIHICYIPLGREKCNVKLSWTTNTSLPITFNNDGDEYYITPEESFALAPLELEDLIGASSENSSTPFYFSFFIGPHKVSIKSAGETLDSVQVDVKCSPQHYWDGTKCWEKGANLLYVFKTTGLAFKSEPAGIICGFAPDVCVSGFSSTTMVTLKAIPLPGYAIGEWYGDCSGSGPTCTVRMDKTRSVGMRVK